VLRCVHVPSGKTDEEAPNPESRAGDGAPEDVPQADDVLDGGESVDSEHAIVDSSDIPDVRSVPGGRGGK
jgi:hypothetical protein